MIRNLIGFLLPGGVVFAAALFAVHRGLLTPWQAQIETIVPYVILGAGFLLGWRFHRSRLAFAVLILILCERILYYFGPGGLSAFGDGKTVFHLTALLLPLNIALIYLLKERGIFNIHGLLKFFGILAQPLVVYVALVKKPALFSSLNHSFFPLPLPETIQLPQTVLFVNAALLLIFFFGSLISTNPVRRGFFWALLAIAAALHGVESAAGGSFYLSVAGVLIILSTIEATYAMAYHDELTGLPARRSLNTTMQGLGRNYSIAMLDIDFFKKFNDRYGHDVGDQVLCLIASHIGRVGGGGKPFRYGGEEFTVVFPGKSKEEVLPHLESLRQSIAGAQFKLRGKNRPRKAPKKRKRKKAAGSVSVTISIGVAESGSKLSGPAAVIKAADKALYRAKKKGRNRVAV